VKRAAVAGVVVVTGLLVLWLQREHARGTFAPVERAFVLWLAANTSLPAVLPPLTLVLYDDEASELAGTQRMGVLDGALFARAASRLGAVAAGIEGLPGDPGRMTEAAGSMPVFGGYDWRQSPGQGWTPLRGEPAPGWIEVPGLAGRPGWFARGFLLPPSSAGGAGVLRLAGRNGDRAVPSFMALAWAVAHGWRWSELVAGGGSLTGPDGRLPLSADGSARFWPAAAPRVLSMNEMLVAAESFERDGGESPFRGHIMVLARATADVTRVAAGGLEPVTPVEQWARAWDAVRHHRLFLEPGPWYAALVAAAGIFLVLGPARRSNRAALLAGFLALLVFALLALGLFGGSRVLLPAAPTLLTLVVALLLGRAGHGAGWFGK
jgi:hypothetical protein